MFMKAAAPVSPACVADRVARLDEGRGGAGRSGEQVVAGAVPLVADGHQILQLLFQLRGDILALHGGQGRVVRLYGEVPRALQRVGGIRQALLFELQIGTRRISIRDVLFGCRQLDIEPIDLDHRRRVVGGALQPRAGSELSLCLRYGSLQILHLAHGVLLEGDGCYSHDQP
jgi:hypothetical protein